MGHKCNKCDVFFKSKYNLQRHLNRKFSCNMLLSDTIPKETTIPSVNNNECYHCHKKFTRKYDLKRHMMNNCKVAKKQTYNEDLESLKIKYKEVQTKRKNIQSKHIDVMTECKKFEKRENELREQIKIIEENKNNDSINISGNNNNVNNNAFNSNNSTINNNIFIIGFGKENLDKINPEIKDIIILLKKGWHSPKYSIQNTHFNEKNPEYHNVYIPDLKNKFTKVYNGDKFETRNTNEVINDLYDKHICYIEEKFEEFGCKVPGSKKRALDGLFKLKKESKYDPEKKIIMDKICEDIKLTLNDNKNLPIETIKYVL